MKPLPDSVDAEEPPGVPGFKTWVGVYTFVLLFFALCVTLLATFSRVFA